MPVKKAIRWVLFWITLSVIFNLGIFLFYGLDAGWKIGQEKALQFLGGYVIEQSLSIDNLFLFLLIFASFGLNSKHQRRVLNYGIIGAIVLRFIFIVLGVAMVSRFEWILDIFGVILIISGIKLLVKNEEIKDFKESKLLKVLGKIIPFTDRIEGQRFFIRKEKMLYATPLLAILIIIEASDILFAIDSIPAIFSITTDVFIIFSSNMFAILGLRSMYFLLEKLHSVFRFVKYGVAVILVFTGIKLSILAFEIKIPLVLSLIIIFSILAASILASVVIKEKGK